MKKNLGDTDRIIRMVLAALFIIVFLSNIVSFSFGIVLFVIAVLLVLTSLVSFCPLYAILGLKTCNTNKVNTMCRNIICGGIISFALLISCNSNSQQTNLSVPEFEKAITQSNIQVLDVRTAGEYQAGHITNALLADWTNEEEFKSRAQALDKSKWVYTYCLSGGRSSAATRWLIENGFTAFNLSGGIAAWKNADKPVEKAKVVTQITLTQYMSQLRSDKTVLVDFSAVWCPPCKIMTPVIDSIVTTNGDRFMVVKIDGGEQSAICKELKVNAFPTFIIYKQGKETWRKQGLVAAKEL
jgi:rhodanese-related sulfurtransferase